MVANVKAQRDIVIYICALYLKTWIYNWNYHQCKGALIHWRFCEIGNWSWCSTLVSRFESKVSVKYLLLEAFSLNLGFYVMFPTDLQPLPKRASERVGVTWWKPKCFITKTQICPWALWLSQINAPFSLTERLWSSCVVRRAGLNLQAGMRRRCRVRVHSCSTCWLVQSSVFPAAVVELQQRPVAVSTAVGQTNRNRLRICVFFTLYLLFFNIALFLCDAVCS